MTIKEPVQIVEDLEASFDTETAFATNPEKKAIFTITGNLQELQQVEMYLNSIGLYYERKDI